MLFYSPVCVRNILLLYADSHVVRLCYRYEYRCSTEISDIQILHKSSFAFAVVQITWTEWPRSHLIQFGTFQIRRLIRVHQDFIRAQAAQNQPGYSWMKSDRPCRDPIKTWSGLITFDPGFSYGCHIWGSHSYFASIPTIFVTYVLMSPTISIFFSFILGTWRDSGCGAGESGAYICETKWKWM